MCTINFAPLRSTKDRPKAWCAISEQLLYIYFKYDRSDLMLDLQTRHNSRHRYESHQINRLQMVRVVLENETENIP